MGGTYMTHTMPGRTAEEALAALTEKLRAGNEAGIAADGEPDWEGWADPQDKCAAGYVQVWDKPVPDEGIEWMRGWCQQNLPASPPTGEPGDKYGPWLAFPLASGGWHFFGWVNT
jgi:hypothetical protein